MDFFLCLCKGTKARVNIFAELLMNVMYLVVRAATGRKTFGNRNFKL